MSKITFDVFFVNVKGHPGVAQQTKNYREAAGIKFGELTSAYSQWRGITSSPKNQNSVCEFVRFLTDGKHEKFDTLKDDATLLESSRVRIAWLNGPHAETLYRAWRIKHDHNSPAD